MWPVPCKVLTSGRAAVVSVPHGPSVQPLWEKPCHLGTALLLGGGGGEGAEGYQYFQAVMETQGLVFQWGPQVSSGMILLNKDGYSDICI